MRERNTDELREGRQEREGESPHLGLPEWCSGDVRRVSDELLHLLDGCTLGLQVLPLVLHLTGQPLKLLLLLTDKPVHRPLDADLLLLLLLSLVAFVRELGEEGGR